MKYIERKPYYDSWMGLGDTKWDVLLTRVEGVLDDTIDRVEKAIKEDDQENRKYWEGAHYAYTAVKKAMRYLDQEEKELLILKQLIEEDDGDE